MADIVKTESELSVRRLLYLCGALLIAIPLLQAAQALWPVMPSSISWRFSAANALSSVLLLPFLGLVIVIIAADATDNRFVARAVGGISALIVIGLVGSLVLFAMDALQLKTVVSTQQTNSFQSISFRVVLVTLVLTGSFSMLMVVAFRRSRDQSRELGRTDNKQGDKGSLLVGRV